MTRSPTVIEPENVKLDQLDLARKVVASEQKRTIRDALGSVVHHPRQSSREDDVLADVERRERSRDLDRSFRVVFHRSVVLRDLERFVVEVLQHCGTGESRCQRIVVAAAAFELKKMRAL